VVRLWADSTRDVPLLTLNKTLENALRKARLQRRVRVGLDDILEKLSAEKKGLDELSQKTNISGTERISRLLLFTSDGAQRFYSNIDSALAQHHPRILGCMLDVDSDTLGRMITGKGGIIKVILIEHKDAVSDILRAIA